MSATVTTATAKAATATAVQNKLAIALTGMKDQFGETFTPDLDTKTCTMNGLTGTVSGSAAGEMKGTFAGSWTAALADNEEVTSSKIDGTDISFTVTSDGAHLAGAVAVDGDWDAVVVNFR